MSERKIYIASKTCHAERWRHLAEIYPVNSTWIYEAGPGESRDLADLWRRCIAEASAAAAIIVYREAGEHLKGAWVELGAALAHGVPAFAVGLDGYSIAADHRIVHCATMKVAMEQALKACRATPPAASAGELEGFLNEIGERCWSLECVDWFTPGGDDADVGWEVVSHHMAAPRRRIEGSGASPIEALRDALSGTTREGGQ